MRKKPAENQHVVNMQYRNEVTLYWTMEQIMLHCGILNIDHNICSCNINVEELVIPNAKSSPLSMLRYSYSVIHEKHSFNLAILSPTDED